MNIPEGATHQSEDGDYLKDTGVNIKIFAEGDWEDVSRWIMLGAIKLDKTEIKADKVESITKDIDWNCDEAEGKNYCLVSSVGTQFFCSELPSHDGIVWYSECNLNTKDSYTLHKRPAQESIYTQEMVDNKELPIVGMNLIFKHNDELINGTVVTLSDDFIIIKDYTGKERVRNILYTVMLPIDTRTQAQKDKEMAVKSLSFVIDNLPTQTKCDSVKLAESLIGSMIDSEFEYLIYTGDK